MLNSAFYSVNFSSLLYGPVVKVENLINHPLKENETLRFDHWGSIHRIDTLVPNRLKFFKRFVFWIRLHINPEGHLSAIDKLLTAFKQHVMDVAKQGKEALEFINHKCEALQL